jgi:hypothetical protein
MAEDDGRHPLKLPQQPFRRVGERPPSVDEAYPVPAGFDDLLERQELSQLRGVHVARDRFYGGNSPELVQGSVTDEITGMEYEVDTLEGIEDPPG